MALLANSLTLVAIALDRYVAVVKIVKSNWEPSGVLCGVFATAIWALAGGLQFESINYNKQLICNYSQPFLAQCGILTLLST